MHVTMVGPTVNRVYCTCDLLASTTVIIIRLYRPFKSNAQFDCTNSVISSEMFVCSSCL
jgi:hypothetical protein